MNKRRIDWMVTLVPFVIIIGIAALLFMLPNESNAVIGQVRFFFGDTLGLYYLVMGLAEIGRAHV